MPLLKSRSEEVYVLSLACNQDQKTFKTSKHRDMWGRLHDKKCETCRNTNTTHSGTHEVVYDAGTSTSYNVVQGVLNRPNVSVSIYD
jgi:hypothetical protein